MRAFGSLCRLASQPNKWGWGPSQHPASPSASKRRRQLPHTTTVWRCTGKGPRGGAGRARRCLVPGRPTRHSYSVAFEPHTATTPKTNVAPVQTKAPQGPQGPRQPPELRLLVAAMARLAALRQRPTTLLGGPDGHAAALGVLGDAGDASHLRLPDPPMGICLWRAALHTFPGGSHHRPAGADGDLAPHMGAMGAG